MIKSILKKGIHPFWPPANFLIANDSLNLSALTLLLHFVHHFGGPNQIALAIVSAAIWTWRTTFAATTSATALLLPSSAFTLFLHLMCHFGGSNQIPLAVISTAIWTWGTAASSSAHLWFLVLHIIDTRLFSFTCHFGLMGHFGSAHQIPLTVIACAKWTRFTAFGHFEMI